MPIEDIIVVLYYLNNLLKGMIDDDIKSRIINFLSYEGHKLFSASLVEKMSKKYQNIVNKEVKIFNFFSCYTSKETEFKFPVVEEIIKASNPPLALPESFFYVRLSDKISDSFKINKAVERALIRFYTLKCLIPVFEELMDKLRISYCIERTNFTLLASLLGYPINEIKQIFIPDSELILKGLLDMHGSESRYMPSSSLLRMIYNYKETYISPKRVLLGDKAIGTLNRNDYDYIADEFDYIGKILEQAVVTKTPGVNILLYGPPGTGKTEIAKAICCQRNIDLYSVSEGSKNAERSSRLPELNMAKTLIGDDARTVLLVDEAEDIFLAHDHKELLYGKLYLNRMLERNKIPTIWITNYIYKIDTALIRRFSYALKMELPPLDARRRIWARMLDKAEIKMDDQDISALASDYELSASFNDTAIRSAQLLSDNGAIRKTLDSLEFAVTGRETKKDSEQKSDFSLELANADMDLAALADRLVDGKIKGFSLCLYGAPGTGKSAYVRYLAERMGLKVSQKRASDLISMYLGQTEENIALAFKVAKRDNKFLIIDEADSFLQDRRNATRSWEVTAVNEMLTWMESHPCPFACTTNLMESLDPASLRRFTFKIKFDFMTSHQARLAFKHFFGCDYPLEIKGLTPGDFAIVLKKVKTLGITEASIIADYLRQEVDLKGNKVKTIGFIK
jgi:SpoVK/Ycf46/Vps4 family AAA+-type ATPase